MITLHLDITVTIPTDADSFALKVADALTAHADYIRRLHLENEGPEGTGEHIQPDGTRIIWERVA